MSRVLRRVAILIGAAAGVAAAAGCARSEPEWTALPDGYVNVLATVARACPDTANTYECARAVELYTLGRGVAGVTRVGKRLTLAIGNGTVVDLVDTPDPSADDYVGYAYTEWMACVGHHLVHVQRQDAEAYLLVHAASGARADLPGVPLLAPDCGRFAVASGSPGGPSVLQIWRLAETGRVALEWTYQPDEPWTAGVPSWQGPTRLHLPYGENEDPQTRRTLHVRLYTDGWRIEP